MKLGKIFSKLASLKPKDRLKVKRFLLALETIEKQEIEEYVEECKTENYCGSEKQISYLLPEDFYVYAKEDSVINWPAPGFEERILPTVNQYLENDGGYVAFYTRDKEKGIYSVGGGIYVVGQIRLKGQYIDRVFHPDGYEHQDISAVEEFKKLGKETFQADCWAGGDTGGWFGIE